MKNTQILKKKYNCLLRRQGWHITPWPSTDKAYPNFIEFAISSGNTENAVSIWPFDGICHELAEIFLDDGITDKYFNLNLIVLDLFFKYYSPYGPLEHFRHYPLKNSLRPRPKFWFYFLQISQIHKFD